MSGKKPEFRRTGDLVWNLVGAVAFGALAVALFIYRSGWFEGGVAFAFGMGAIDCLGNVRDELNKPKATVVVEREPDRG